MLDRREQILARLIVIAEAIPGIAKAARNRQDVSGAARPAIIITDGHEVSDPQPNTSRPSNAPALIDMTPEIVILYAAKSEDVGSGINTLRRYLIKAVLTDTELQASVGTNGFIRYDGLLNELTRAKDVAAETNVNFTIRYPLIVSEL